MSNSINLKQTVTFSELLDEFIHLLQVPSNVKAYPSLFETIDVYHVDADVHKDDVIFSIAGVYSIRVPDIACHDSKYKYFFASEYGDSEKIKMLDLYLLCEERVIETFEKEEQKKYRFKKRKFYCCNTKREQYMQKKQFIQRVGATQSYQRVFD